MLPWLVYNVVMVGTWYCHGWYTMLSWLVHNVVMVGTQCCHGWYTMLSWLVHNYVVVGIFIHVSYPFCLCIHKHMISIFNMPTYSVDGETESYFKVEVHNFYGFP